MEPRTIPMVVEVLDVLRRAMLLVRGRSCCVMTSLLFSGLIVVNVRISAAKRRSLRNGGISHTTPESRPIYERKQRQEDEENMGNFLRV